AAARVAPSGELLLESVADAPAVHQAPGCVMPAVQLAARRGARELSIALALPSEPVLVRTPRCELPYWIVQGRCVLAKVHPPKAGGIGGNKVGPASRHIDEVRTGVVDGED